MRYGSFKQSRRRYVLALDRTKLAGNQSQRSQKYTPKKKGKGRRERPGYEIGTTVGDARSEVSP